MASFHPSRDVVQVEAQRYRESQKWPRNPEKICKSRLALLFSLPILSMLGSLPRWLSMCSDARMGSYLLSTPYCKGQTSSNPVYSRNGCRSHRSTLFDGCWQWKGMEMIFHSHEVIYRDEKPAVWEVFDLVDHYSLHKPQILWAERKHSPYIGECHNPQRHRAQIFWRALRMVWGRAGVYHPSYPSYV